MLFEVFLLFDVFVSWTERLSYLLMMFERCEISGDISQNDQREIVKQHTRSFLHIEKVRKAEGRSASAEPCGHVFRPRSTVPPSQSPLKNFHTKTKVRKKKCVFKCTGFRVILRKRAAANTRILPASILAVCEPPFLYKCPGSLDGRLAIIE
jgi:hypothetical protein